MEVLLLCKELPKNDKGDKIAQLKDSQHDPLFMSDMQAISDDFTSVDNEAWSMDCRGKIINAHFSNKFAYQENGILSVKLPKEWAEKDVNKEFIKVPDLLVENWLIRFYRF